MSGGEHDILIGLIRDQLGGEKDPQAIERIVLGFGEQQQLPRDLMVAIAQRLIAEVQPAAGAAASEAAAGPRLLLDLGQDLRVGHQVAPEFHLVCPGYRKKPRVRAVLSEALDQRYWKPEPTLHPQEAGYWTFREEFSLTSGGATCRPGQYFIDLRLDFPEGSVHSPLRHFLAHIRITVLDPSRDPQRTLIVEGDGHSMLNLQGRDLSSYAQVVLRGGGSAVVNVQEALFSTPGGEGPGRTGAPPRESKERNVCAFLLKPDLEQQPPQIPAGFARGEPLDAATLVLANRRIHLLARSSITLGRERDNDIVLRLLPPTPESKEKSVSISRKHLRLRLSNAGLQLTDLEARLGTTVGGEKLRGSLVLVEGSASCVVRVADVLDLKLQLFSLQKARLAEGAPLEDQDVLETTKAEASGLWRLAQGTGIDAVRIKRIDNLAEEEYVLLYRQMLVGRSARLLFVGGAFWLENLSPRTETRVDGYRLEPRELVPLRPGMVLTFGSTTVRFARYEQMHLAP